MLVFSPEPWEGHPRCTHTPEAYYVKLGFPGTEKLANVCYFYQMKPYCDIMLTHHLNPKVKCFSQFISENRGDFKACRKPQLCRRRGPPVPQIKLSLQHNDPLCRAARLEDNHLYRQRGLSSFSSGEHGTGDWTQQLDSLRTSHLAVNSGEAVGELRNPRIHCLIQIFPSNIKVSQKTGVRNLEHII